MKPILIRPFQTSDSSQLTVIQVCAIKKLSKPYYTPKELQSLIEDKSKLRNFNESIWVAIVEDIPVGFIAIANDKPWINGLFVHPDFARQKIGTKLIKTIEKEVMKLNWRCLWVYASLNGRAFYQAQGYRVLKQDKILLQRQSFPVVLMKKKLITKPKAQIQTISAILFLVILIIFIVLMILLLMLLP
jgi:putative acetyltransferase